MALSDATRLANFATGIGTDSTLDLKNIEATGFVSVAGSITGGGGSIDGNVNMYGGQSNAR